MTVSKDTIKQENEGLLDKSAALSVNGLSVCLCLAVHRHVPGDMLKIVLIPLVKWLPHKTWPYAPWSLEI